MLMVDGAVEKNVVITYSTHPEKKTKKTCWSSMLLIYNNNN